MQILTEKHMIFHCLSMQNVMLPPTPRNCDYVSCCCPKLVSGLPTSVPLSAHLTILFCISDEVQLLVTSARIF